MKRRDIRALRREDRRKKLEAKLRKKGLLGDSEGKKSLTRELKRAEERRERAIERRKELWLPAEPDIFVGRLEYIRKGGIVFVNHKMLRDNIVVPTPLMHGAQEGDKVVVRLTKKGSARVMPMGEVIDVLGKDGDNDAEMHAILAEYNLPYSYPEDMSREADKITSDITADEISRRRDMRDTLTFTIDPHDAKDFDDALSYKVLDDGQYEVGVHIADVTHYVRQGSLIDEEAYRRATSVYLVDRTVPMLPEHLCNEICSLREGEDKLTFSVVFTLDNEANVLHYDICRTIICSDKRLNYEEAELMIEGGEENGEKGKVKSERREDLLTAALKALNDLAKKMRERRFAQGAVDFEHDEIAFDIDAEGHPTGVHIKRSTDANHLIEEFMLLANRTVATHVGKILNKPFVYRVHDIPDRERLKNLSGFIGRFGYRLETKSVRMATISRNINNLLRDAKGKPEQTLIEMLAIRSMAKAVYSTDNIGHYGLAFKYYTHFTSPIRRYPDMMVHRLLTEYLRMESGERRDESVEKYEQMCKHCSEREQLAATAERASIKYKQAEYMQHFIGQEFDGIISGLTEWGVFVELNESKAEGMIPIRHLIPQDYYSLDESGFELRGSDTGKTFTIGSPIRIQVVNADPLKRQLDFELAEG